MLAATDTRLLGDALRPPRGYELDHLVITTYSLDLSSLLSVPLAFTSFAAEDADGEPLRDPLLLLEGLRRNAERVTVFHEFGKVAIPARRESLFVHVEHSLVPVEAPAGGAFHPKLWVCTYSAPELPQAVRLLCLSRNLTSDRSRDTILCLEGVETKGRHNTGLCDFLDWLADNAAAAGSHREQAVRRAAKVVRATTFAPPEGFEKVVFRPLGIPRYRRDPLQARRDRILVISPFLSSERLAEVTSGAAKNILVSRADQIAAMDPTVLARFEDVYTLNDAIEPEKTDDADEPQSTAHEEPLRGLHAKLFVADQGHSACIWTGSANATNAAFSRNVEFLVELHGRKGSCGIKAILGGLEGGTLRSMLVPFEAPDDVVPIDDHAERELDRIARLIAALPLRAHVEVVGSSHTVSLGGDVGDALADLPLVGLRSWPVTLAPTFAAALELGSDPAAVFSGVPLVMLTEFFVVEATCSIDGQRLQKRFVAQWRLVGAPEGREHAVLLSLLGDPQRVLAFIRLLLSEPAGDMLGVGAPPHLSLGASHGSEPFGWVSDTEPLFESMIRALEADPERLVAVSKIVEDLTAADGGSDRLPPGFLEIWRPIWDAHEQMRAGG